MARLGIIFGLLLCGVTVAAMLQTPQKDPSQLYAMMIGIPILFCGVVSLNPHRRRVATMISLTLAFLGAIGGLSWLSLRLSGNGLPSSDAPSHLPIFGMTTLCCALILGCIIGFSHDRKQTLKKQ